MKEHNVNVSLYQKVSDQDEPIHFDVEMPRITLERMKEIRQREPKVDWTNRDMDLADLAAAELQEEGKLPNLSPERQAAIQSLERQLEELEKE